jgi:hypothetical protein
MLEKHEGIKISEIPTKVVISRPQQHQRESSTVPDIEEKGGECCGTGSGEDIKPALIG